MYEVLKLVFAVMTFFGGGHLFVQWWSMRWPEVSGAIIEMQPYEYHQSMTTGVKQERILLRYRYQVNGEEYFGTRIAVGINHIEKKNLSHVLVGRDVTNVSVRYCPWKPGYALLNAEYGNRSLLFILTAICALILGGLLV